MALLDKTATDLRVALLTATTIIGTNIPSQEVIRMTVRRLVYKHILDPDLIIEEIARLPGLTNNNQGVVLEAVRPLAGYQTLKTNLQRLQRRKNLTELCFEILSLIIVVGFGIAVIPITDSWGLGVPRILCGLPWIYSILSRSRFRRHYHILVFT